MLLFVTVSRKAVSRLVRVAVLACALGAASGCVRVRPLCRLRPFHTGICQIGMDHAFGAGYSAGERVPFVIYSFFVESADGRRALIDLGPESLEYTNAMFRRFSFLRDLGAGLPPERRYPDDIVQPHGNIFRHLGAIGVAPREIEHIVFTHLHADHHGMDDATDGGAAERFPNATLHVSAIAWRDNLARRVEGRWASYVDFAFSDFLVREEREGRARFADGAEVFSGVQDLPLRLGGETRGFPLGLRRRRRRRGSRRTGLFRSVAGSRTGGARVDDRPPRG